METLRLAFISAETRTAYFPKWKSWICCFVIFQEHIVDVHVKTNSMRDLKLPHSVALSRIQSSAM